MYSLQRNPPSSDENRVPGSEPAATPAASGALADTATAVGIIHGSDQGLESLMTEVRGRFEALHDPLSPAAAAELQRQLPVLEALFLRFSAEATTTRKGPVHQALLLRAALQAQQAYARTFALLHTLACQARATTPLTIEIHDDDEDAPDSE